MINPEQATEHTEAFNRAREYFQTPEALAAVQSWFEWVAHLQGFDSFELDVLHVSSIGTENVTYATEDHSSIIEVRIDWFTDEDKVRASMQAAYDADEAARANSLPVDPGTALTAEEIDAFVAALEDVDVAAEAMSTDDALQTYDVPDLFGSTVSLAGQMMAFLVSPDALEASNMWRHWILEQYPEAIIADFTDDNFVGIGPDGIEFAAGPEDGPVEVPWDWYRAPEQYKEVILAHQRGDCDCD